MERARFLYDRIVNEGEEAIDDFIESRAGEELFLEFKRSSDNGRERRLSQTDRNNLAKAISGFGNSSGGVVVWGVDCSPDNEGADVAHTKFPIINVRRFVANLNGAVSGCTIPVHNKIEHHAAVSENGQGFAVTYIPQSDNAPHQVIGRNAYYIRAGSDFVPAPHQVLAGMFGRRPQPNVFHMIVVAPASNEGDTLILNYSITVTNGGPGIASDVFFNAMIHEGLGDNTQISWEFHDRDNWTGNFVFGRQVSIISKNDFRLAPTAFLIPLSLRLELREPFTADLLIKGNIGCAGSPTMNIDFENDSDTVRNLYDEYFTLLADGSETDFRHRIATDILAIPPT